MANWHNSDNEIHLLRKLLQTFSAEAAMVGSPMAVVAAELTRPADTTTYTANDAVANSTSAPTVITFSNIARVTGGSGYITNAKLVKSTTGVTGASFRLWLYSAAPTAINDNAAFPIKYADRAGCQGYIDLYPTTEGTGSDCAVALQTGVGLKFKCAEGSQSLYGLLEATGAYAPGNAEKFYLELTADQN